MRNVTQRQWDSWNIVGEMEKFFILRWNELFSDNSHESWKVRTCNVLFLLEEIEESSQIATKQRSHHTNIKSLLEELKEVAGDDIVVKCCYPNTAAYIKEMEDI
jgi:hypothetical protein